MRGHNYPVGRNAFYGRVRFNCQRKLALSTRNRKSKGRRRKFARGRTEVRARHPGPYQDGALEGISGMKRPTPRTRLPALLVGPEPTAFVRGTAVRGLSQLQYVRLHVLHYRGRPRLRPIRESGNGRSAPFVLAVREFNTVPAGLDRPHLCRAYPPSKRPPKLVPWSIEAVPLSWESRFDIRQALNDCANLGPSLSGASIACARRPPRLPGPGRARRRPQQLLTTHRGPSGGHHRGCGSLDTYNQTVFRT